MKNNLSALGYVMAGAVFLIALLFFMQHYQQSQLVRAAKNGDMVSMYALGEAYLDGSLGLKPDSDEALRWFGEAVKGKYIPAMIRLAKIYATGEGAPRNAELSFNLYVMAANYGNVEASMMVGRALYTGNGAEMDHGKAIGYLKIAADGNNAEAQELMGEIYFEGKYQDCNVEKARDYLSRAVAQNNEEAKLWLAALDRGEGCKKKDLTPEETIGFTPIPQDEQDKNLFPPPVNGMSSLENAQGSVP